MRKTESNTCLPTPFRSGDLSGYCGGIVIKGMGGIGRFSKYRTPVKLEFQFKK